MGKQVRVPLGGPGTVDPLTAGLSNSWGRDLGRSSWALPSARSGRQEPRGNFLTYCRAWEGYRGKDQEEIEEAEWAEKRWRGKGKKEDAVNRQHPPVFAPGGRNNSFFNQLCLLFVLWSIGRSHFMINMFHPGPFKTIQTSWATLRPCLENIYSALSFV